MTGYPIYYDHVKQALTGTQTQKAQKFVAQGCVRLVEEGKWDVGPLKGYNSRTYRVQVRQVWRGRRIEKEFVCNCQWAAQGRGPCSHQMAVVLSEQKADAIRQ